MGVMMHVNPKRVFLEEYIIWQLILVQVYTFQRIWCQLAVHPEIMFLVIQLLFILLLLILYRKSWNHPKTFPPGPRFPIPFLGDTYMIGNDYKTGFHLLHKKYGASVGMWMGRHRAVLISDFEILQDIMNKPETTLRAHSIPEMRSNINDWSFLILVILDI